MQYWKNGERDKKESRLKERRRFRVRVRVNPKALLHPITKTGGAKKPLETQDCQ
jgi:hypothetical protein